MSPKCLLIGGCPRSGTTALTDLLNIDGRILVTREFHLFEQWKKPLSQIMIGREVLSLNRAAVLDKHNLNRRDFNSFTGQMFFNYLRRRTNCEWIGDKVPRYYLENAQKIARQFPEARFIFCLRDGRDVIASQIRLWNRGVVKNFTAPNVGPACHLWMNANTILKQLKFSPLKDRILIIKYETAIKDPQWVADITGKWLGLGELDITGHEYKPVHFNAWREEIPDMMNRLPEKFIKLLNFWGYH